MRCNGGAGGRMVCVGITLMYPLFLVTSVVLCEFCQAAERYASVDVKGYFTFTFTIEIGLYAPLRWSRCKGKQNTQCVTHRYQRCEGLAHQETTNVKSQYDSRGNSKWQAKLVGYGGPQSCRLMRAATVPILNIGGRLPPGPASSV